MYLLFFKLCFFTQGEDLRTEPGPGGHPAGQGGDRHGAGDSQHGQEEPRQPQIRALQAQGKHTRDNDLPLLAVMRIRIRIIKVGSGSVWRSRVCYC